MDIDDCKLALIIDVSTFVNDFVNGVLNVHLVQLVIKCCFAMLFPLVMVLQMKEAVISLVALFLMSFVC